jgi:translation initiation factor IF-1
MTTALAIACCVQTISIIFLAPHMARRVAAAPAVQETRQLALTAAQSLTLDNDDGSVVIRTAPGGTIQAEVSLTIYTRKRGLDAEAQEYAAQLIDVRETDNGISIITEPSSRPENLEVSVKYAFTVPEGTDVRLRCANGNVRVAKGCGAVSVRGRNTDVSISDPQGEVEVETTNGRIRVARALSGADLQTVNGAVYAHVGGGELRAATTNGLILARILDANVEACHLKTLNGGISVIMAEGCSARLEARTARGRVNSDDFDAMDVSEGMKRQRHVRGIIGDGRTNLTMDTLNGNILLKRAGS